tara:strand:+ start:67 stop:501 length:435 start_codon:yes stop_codon:yes gene_type:complete
MRKLIILITITILCSQPNEGSLSPVVTYWKTLTNEEKEIFLFSYLTQVYETHSELKNSIGFGGITEWYYDNRAEMVYGIFDQLEIVRISEIVRWIDEFYSHGDYANRPFIEALEFAYRFAEASGANMWEKYENLKFDKIKPGKE